jgi:iron transport multicopper oxidase
LLALLTISQDLFDKIPPALNPNVTGWLVYDSNKPLPAPANISVFEPYDDSTLVPYDNKTRLPDPDYTATMSFQMSNLGDGAN